MTPLDHSLNGHGLNGHSQNGHIPPEQPEQYAYKPTWRDNIEDWWMGTGDFKYTLIGILFWVGLFACLMWFGSLQPVESAPDPYSTIETKIDNIDLDQPKHDIRNELDEIKSAVEDLRPGEEPDRPTLPGGA